MKRKSIALLALALCLMCFSSAFALEQADVLGDWYLNTIVSGAASINPATVGMSMSISIKEDGTASILTSNATDELAAEATWKIDGETLVITDSKDIPVTFTAKDGTLTGSQDGTEMFFGREKPTAADAYVPAAQKTGVAAEDFNGKWVTTIVETVGMQMPIETIGMNVSMDINGLDVLYAFSLGEDTQEQKMTAVFQDDTLVIGSGDNSLILKLLEDGKMTYSDPAGATIFYCEKEIVTE